MLDKERIKEAQSNVTRYLSENLIRKVEVRNPVIKKIFIGNSTESLSVAEILHRGNHSNLWVIVTSYYAMYYISNAVLYELGYKIGEQISHKVTADALIVYVMEKLKRSLLEDYEEAKEEALELSGNRAHELIEDFDKERNKRSRFQYATTETALKSKAQTSIERAKKFVLEMRRLLIEPEKRSNERSEQRVES